MIGQISGSFNTAAAEIEAVKRFVSEHSSREVKEILKYPNRDDADVEVVFEDGSTLLFEVKYESADRWNRYGEYGFEGGAWNPRTGHYKPSKAEYSKADIWLFYSVDKGRYIMMNGYWFCNDVFTHIQVTYGQYKETSSINYETGKADRWNSSVYFVNPKYIEHMKVNRI
ncbi:MAG: hypothetical protein J6N21_11830 [Butyrivibrio sp.]|nr:hypothetical protein [Butyrivibrio sp.]